MQFHRVPLCSCMTAWVSRHCVLMGELYQDTFWDDIPLFQDSWIWLALNGYEYGLLESWSSVPQPRSWRQPVLHILVDSLL